jgi:hypothetical protein
VKSIVLAVLLTLVAGASPAGEDPLRAADRALRIARRHLRAAPHDYQGHRRAAVEEVSAALVELRRAVEAVRERDVDVDPEDDS